MLTVWHQKRRIEYEGYKPESIRFRTAESSAGVVVSEHGQLACWDGHPGSRSETALSRGSDSSQRETEQRDDHVVRWKLVPNSTQVFRLINYLCHQKPAGIAPAGLAVKI